MKFKSYWGQYTVLTNIRIKFALPPITVARIREILRKFSGLEMTKAPQREPRTQHQQNLSSLHWAGYTGRTLVQSRMPDAMQSRNNNNIHPEIVIIKVDFLEYI